MPPHHVPDSYCHPHPGPRSPSFPPTHPLTLTTMFPDTWLSGDEMETDDLFLVISPLCASVFSSAKWDHNNISPNIQVSYPLHY